MALLTKSVRKLTSQSRYLDLTSVEDRFFSPTGEIKQDREGDDIFAKNGITEMIIESEAE